MNLTLKSEAQAFAFVGLCLPVIYLLVVYESIYT